MKRISRADVEHIARLARIRLSREELAAFEVELSSILDFVAKLEEVASADVEPLAGGHDLTNIMRDDARAPALEAEAGPELVRAAPQRRDGYVAVKAVFDREQS